MVLVVVVFVVVELFPLELDEDVPIEPLKLGLVNEALALAFVLELFELLLELE